MLYEERYYRWACEYAVRMNQEIMRRRVLTAVCALTSERKKSKIKCCKKRCRVNPIYQAREEHGFFYATNT